jgi:hypothetical protein
MRDRMLHLARTRYVGFNDHHLGEKLGELEGISLGRETLRRLLRQNGLGSPRNGAPLRTAGVSWGDRITLLLRGDRIMELRHMGRDRLYTVGGATYIGSL